MSNVSNTNPAGTIPYLTDFAVDPTTTSLTPESLMVYCSSRLSTLDTNLKQYFLEQKQFNKVSVEMSKVIELAKMGDGQNGGDALTTGKDPLGSRQANADKANALLALYRSCETPEAKKAAAAEFRLISGQNIEDYADGKSGPSEKTILTHQTDIKQITSVEANTRIDGLKETQSAATKGAELSMIQLQSLVSQRQLAVQLTTQMMQTMHETAKGVLGNIRS